MSDGQVVFEIDPAKVARRRRQRTVHLGVDVSVLLIAGILAGIAAFAPWLIDVRNPGLLGLGIAALFAVGGYATWSDLRKLRTTNDVLVTTVGFSPPFKSPGRLPKGDWFVRYREIESMSAATGSGNLVPAYNVTLRDGFTFQLNAIDLLVYVGDREVREYARILSIVSSEVGRQESRERVERGEDIIIARERLAMSP